MSKIDTVQEKFWKWKYTRKISKKSTNDISLGKSYIVEKGGGKFLHDNERIQVSDLIGIYGEIAELVSVESAIKIYEHFKGQQISFPMHLYTKEFIVSQCENTDGKAIRELAVKFGYSERRLRQILNERNQRRNSEHDNDG